MRLFCRVLGSQRNATLWMPDGSSVLEAKRQLHAARLFADDAAVEDLVLVQGSRRVADKTLLEEIASKQFPNQVHAVMMHVGQLPLACDGRVARIEPSDGAGAVGAFGGTTISLHLTLHCKEPSLDFSSVLSVYSDRNEFIDGTVIFDASTRTFRFAAAQDLAPDCAFNVFADLSCLSDQPVLRSPLVLWSFRTKKLAGLRLPVELASEDGAPPQHAALVAVSRQSRSIYLEMLQSIAAALSPLSSGVRVEWFNLTEITARRLWGDMIDIRTCGDVALLNNSDTLSVRVDPSLVEPPLPPLTQMTEQELARYYENNWVNSESGFYAVCGKLGVEEENELILGLVSALGGEEAQGAVEAKADLVVTPAQAQARADIECIDPSATIIPAFPSPDTPIFPLTSEYSLPSPLARREFASRLCSHGFAYVTLDQELFDTVSRVLQLSRDYFAQPTEVKREHRHFVFTYWGYKYNPVLSKEFYQLRRASPRQRLASALDKGQTTQALASAADTAYSALHALTTGLAREVLLELGADSGYLDELFEPAEDDASFTNQLSCSNLSLYHYFQAPPQTAFGAPTIVSCPIHSDMSLITAIPIIETSSSPSFHALHLWDQVSDAWVAVEGPAVPPCTCLVFGGEMMAYLTSNAVLPAMHEVSSSGAVAAEAVGARLSAPFQLLAARKAVLDPGRVRDGMAAGGGGGDAGLARPAVVCGQFMDSLSSARLEGNRAVLPLSL